jgi:hypothetical protein
VNDNPTALKRAKKERKKLVNFLFYFALYISSRLSTDD